MKSGTLANTLRASLAGLALASLGACSGTQSGGKEVAAPAAAAGPVVVTINGQAVPQSLFDALAAARGLDLANPQQRERALKQLTDLVLVDQLAKKEGYVSDPDYAAALELGRLQSVSTAATRHLQKTAAVDDAALQAEYDRQAAKSAGQVYDFSQLIYADQAAARKAAAAINAKPFDATLESYRKDARSARNYDKVRAAQLMPAMATALGTLKPGETAKEPVQLPQGWTVLHLTAVGEMPQPSFEQVKEGLRRSLSRRVADDRVAKLREGATIVAADPPPTPAVTTIARPAPAPAVPVPPAQAAKE